LKDRSPPNPLVDLYHTSEPGWLNLRDIYELPQQIIERKLTLAQQLTGLDIPYEDLSTLIPVERLHVIPRKRVSHSNRVPAKIDTTAPTGPQRALARWITRGKPQRPPDEIDHIYNTHCKTCQAFDAEQAVCRDCGSCLCGSEPRLLTLLEQPDEKPILNKIRVAIEHCPRWLW
jgi:hypothetical protein